jgi:D-glycero-beta-D-manno-heptose 1-phosphate adenylyltransferase
MRVRSLEEKLIPRERIALLCNDLRLQGKKIVTTNGCFDLLHLGHITYLMEARQLGDLLIVGINSDLSVKKLKGESRPICQESARARQLAGLESVDFVCVFEESTPEKWLGEVRPDIHVKGGDYQPQNLPETRVVESLGGKVTCLSLIQGYSTSDMIHKIKTIG